jgi:sodium/bile acid cotransporter 7
LIALAILIAAGLTIGKTWSPERVKTVTAVFDPPATSVIVSTVLFLMAFSLENRHLRDALRAPGPVLWASGVNLGFIPLLGWALMPIQQSPDFQIGLMIAVSVPCSMAAASVWTRKGGGNDAVSLLVSVLTNGVCFAVTPLWLSLATARDVELDAGEMVQQLVWAVLVPSLLGQVARLVPLLARLATAYKTPIGVLAQSCILAIVFSAACKAGIRMNGVNAQDVTLWGVLLVWGTCITIHLVGMTVGVFGATRFGFRRPDVIAIAFAGSQKTMPIGVLLATEVTMFGDPNLLGPGLGVPFAVFPMLMYHASQLFIDTAIADRFAAQQREARSLSTCTVDTAEGVADGSLIS